MTTALVRLRHDETLYSGLARLSRYHLVGDAERLQCALFGEAVAVFDDLPVGLGRIVASEVFGPADVDHALHEWTVFPYHAHYVDPARARVAARAMEASGRWPHKVLGSWSVLPPPERLRFCRSCLDDMLERHPDPWWMRVHQLPSVLVCPDHAELLCESNVGRRERRKGFVSADLEAAPADSPVVVANVEPRVVSDLLRLARASDALLDRVCDQHPDDRRMDYLAALRRLDMLDRAGEAKLPSIARAMDGYWGRTLDLWPGLAKEGRCRQGWLGRLLRGEHGSPPLHHLLLELLMNARLRHWR